MSPFNGSLVSPLLDDSLARYLASTGWRRRGNPGHLKGAIFTRRYFSHLPIGVDILVLADDGITDQSDLDTVVAGALKSSKALLGRVHFPTSCFLFVRAIGGNADIKGRSVSGGRVLLTPFLVRGGNVIRPAQDALDPLGTLRSNIEFGTKLWNQEEAPERTSATELRRLGVIVVIVALLLGIALGIAFSIR